MYDHTYLACDMYYISRGLCDHNELLYSCYNKSCDIIGDCKFCVRKALKLKSPVGQQQLYTSFSNNTLSIYAGIISRCLLLCNKVWSDDNEVHILIYVTALQYIIHILYSQLL